MFLVDTNVLVYAADRRATEHPVCLESLERWRRRDAPWYVSWGVLYEFLRIVTHPRVLRRPWSARSAWQFVQRLLAAPALGVLTESPRHRSVLHQLVSEDPRLAGNLFHDAHIAAVMREHGLRRIVTYDRDFGRFDFVQAVEPPAADPGT